jgi:hypothetical protein
MRASVIGTAIVSCAFVVGVAAAAQEKPAPAAQKEHTMTGCLQKGADAKSFVVNNTAEKGPKVIGIVSSSADLGPHVGHKIDITGTAVPNAEAEAMKPAPPKADHYMRLTAVKMVAATCP